jgi:hypothetical protein
MKMKNNTKRQIIIYLTCFSRIVNKYVFIIESVKCLFNQIKIIPIIYIWNSHALIKVPNFLFRNELKNVNLKGDLRFF